MGRKNLLSIEEIKNLLLGQLHRVVENYAPPASGSHTTHGKYYTLNPGRADKSVGSFCVTMTGADAGRWADYATKQSGDILDLINLSLNGNQGNIVPALKEARAFLGLETMDPATRRRREEAAEKARVNRRKAEAEKRDKREKRRRFAQAIFISGQQSLKATPVDFYLKDNRGIDLATLGRQPGCLRFLPQSDYYHEDEKTGEVIEGKFPAMAAAVSDASGNFVAVHRTWLNLRDGQWQKADVPKPKKALGAYWGSGINIWRGLGPRGGKPESLPQCPEGTHVYLTEGIEDALSVVVLAPHLRVVCAISLGNLADIQLPKNVSTITLVADQDENEEQKAAREAAIISHQRQGRTVRVWLNRHGGKDLNDALRMAED